MIFTNEHGSLTIFRGVDGDKEDEKPKIEELNEEDEVKPKKKKVRGVEVENEELNNTKPI